MRFEFPPPEALSLIFNGVQIANDGSWRSPAALPLLVDAAGVAVADATYDLSPLPADVEFDAESRQLRGAPLGRGSILAAAYSAMRNGASVASAKILIKPMHRRAQIDNVIAETFAPLLNVQEVSQYPFMFKTVQKRYMHWTALQKQEAIPALVLSPADLGAKPLSPAAGFIDEQYPLNASVVLEEVRGGTSIVDQASDVQSAVEGIFNKKAWLEVEGVLEEGTRIEGWRNSEERLYPVLVIQFRIIVEHRYRSGESV